ncbi:Pimeloyl-ACP methyl ester carboxylesterase [Meinhardsimonia xiamenensis]|jgi:pimeloyl-ACP methyl ester carboxylesterase|uniref:Pimeloyl-ACP methyl ester carboxylesterase n=1 Tax=Meinhardsimonia xiamenensis TaxID=990712 RepID=A0A1G9AZI3_9RHOB|nr:alpha/beta hydrolase [Meinhardsimonia xiamenensis]PRX35185.1 pimeloyl-ACP methyl ester carboxylesterase [Meinhardsimonia xiamenensis]SDK32682.1 Pimeloyl-ACP methyl ester carboxylesterase [Meinhardsimonia xiamenensis]
MGAEPLVLLPDMMSDARLFAPQIEALSREVPVMVMPMTGGDSIARLARNLLEAAPPRFAVAGLGLGGMVAMEALAQSRDRVTRLCLMDTSAQAELASVAAAREPRIIRARTGRLAEVIREEMGLPAAALDAQGRQLAETVMRMALDLGPEVFVAQSRALQRRPDQQATLRRARTPALVICGEEDRLYPLRRHEFIAQLMPLARLEVIPGAGHLPTLERPRLVTALLRRWLLAPAGRVLA